MKSQPNTLPLTTTAKIDTLLFCLQEFLSWTRWVIPQVTSLGLLGHGTGGGKNLIFQILKGKLIMKGVGIKGQS